MTADSSTRVALISDDLTGACDAAVKFRNRGAHTLVSLLDVSLGSDNDVIAVSTETRDLSATEIDQRICAVADRLAPWSPELVFKKIDSTLRGNAGTEIRAAFEAFGCELAVITPAFPDMARIVRDGYLYVESHDSWQPVHVATRLRSQSLSECQHLNPVALSSAIHAGQRFLSLEAACNDDLAAIVAALRHEKRRILWAGSAGLASALADAFFSTRQAAAAQPKRSPLPVLYCIGSDHPVTIAQMGTLLSEAHAHRFSVETASASDIAASIDSGHHIIFAISRHSTQEIIRDLLHPSIDKIAALFLCGGDTASLVCQSLGVDAINLRGEIVTGLPWGRLSGGLFSNLPVATKSGGFGAPDALIKVASFFTCQTN